jgi:hypothetical protein
MNHSAVPAMNIGPREQRKRLVIGWVLLGVGVAVSLLLTLSDANRWLRLTVFIPFWFGILAVAEARTKT